MQKRVPADRRQVHDRRENYSISKAGHSSRLLELITKLIARLLQTNTTLEVLDVIAITTVETLKYHDCVLYLFENNKLIKKSAHAENEEIENDEIIVLEIGEGIVGSAAQQMTSIVVQDTKLDSRYVIDDLERRSELAVPIIFGDKLLGIIDSEHPEPNFYTESDVEMIESIASISATRLHATINSPEVSNELNRDSWEKAKEVIEILSSVDTLTGTLNRRGFERQLQKTKDQNKEISVAILDLDRFKIINDELGHDAGDYVLKEFGQMLDTVNNSSLQLTVARLGGDEFAIIYHGAERSEFELYINKVITSVKNERLYWRGTEFQFGVSAGICHENQEQVWEKADKALIISKKQKLSSYLVYNASKIDDQMLA